MMKMNKILHQEIAVISDGDTDCIVWESSGDGRTDDAGRIFMTFILQRQIKLMVRTLIDIRVECT